LKIAFSKELGEYRPTAMSTSLICHAFGPRGYGYVPQDYAANIILAIQPKDDLISCLCCRSRKVIRHGFAGRRIQTVPIGFKPPGWSLSTTSRMPQLCCRRFDRHSGRRGKYTKAFERYALALAKNMPVQDVADLLGAPAGIRI